MIALFLLLVAQNNPNDTALGGRTGLMGGAGAAQGRDEAMLWLNPAGLAGIDEAVFSLTLGAYGLSTVRVLGAFRDPAIRDEMAWRDDGFSSRLEIIPSSVGFFLGMGSPRGEAGHHVLGAGVIRPASADFSLSASYRETGLSEIIVEEVMRQEARPTAFGLSYAVEVGAGLALGASFFAVSTPERFTRETSYDFFDHETWAQRAMGETEVVTIQYWAIQAVAGAQWRRSPFALGLSVKPPRIPLSATGRGHLEMLGVAGTTGGMEAAHFIREAILEDGFDDRGWSLLGGFAWMPDELTVELDAGLYLPMVSRDRVAYAIDDLDLAGSSMGRKAGTLELEVPTRVAWNVALGAELPLGGWALLAGLFTDRSTAAVRDDETGRYARTVDRLGATLGIGLGGGPVRTHIGARYTYGIGSYGALAASRTDAGGMSLEPRLADLVEHRAQILISGALELGGGGT